MDEVISPLADKKLYGGSMIDYNVRAERMGWLPSAPQLQTNPLQVVRDAQAAGMDPKDYAVKALKDGTLEDELRGSRSSEQLAAQPVRVALEPAGLERQGARVLPQAPARHEQRRAGQGPGAAGGEARRKWSGTTRRPRASSTCW